MKVWAKTEEYKEGKYLVVRRDGTIPLWPHFVLGARDPAAADALRHYAEAADAHGADCVYTASILDLAHDFDTYRRENGDGDPEAAPHRKDDPYVLNAMRGQAHLIYVKPGASKGETLDVTAVDMSPSREVIERLLSANDRLSELPDAVDPAVAALAVDTSAAAAAAAATAGAVNAIRERAARHKRRERKVSGEEARCMAAIATELESLAAVIDTGAYATDGKEFRCERGELSDDGPPQPAGQAAADAGFRHVVEIGTEDSDE